MSAERYWEGRWRDEAAENKRLREELMQARQHLEYVLAMLRQLYEGVRREQTMSSLSATAPDDVSKWARGLIDDPSSTTKAQG